MDGAPLADGGVDLEPCEPCGATFSASGSAGRCPPGASTTPSASAAPAGFRAHTLGASIAIAS
jgi:hypothetical protein